MSRPQTNHHQHVGGHTLVQVSGADDISARARHEPPALQGGLARFLFQSSQLRHGVVNVGDRFLQALPLLFLVCIFRFLQGLNRSPIGVGRAFQARPQIFNDCQRLHRLFLEQ